MKLRIQDLDGEEWRQIEGHPFYFVSNKSRVKSIDRQVKCRNGYRTAHGQIIQPFISKSTGYLQVALNDASRNSVHRIVAMAWVDGYFDGAHVDHVNGIRTDNRIENLNWVTPRENMLRSYKLGRKGTCLGKYSGEHPTSKAVVSTCLKSGIEKNYESAMDAVREGFDSSSISRCCNGIWQTHKGHKWRFNDDPKP